MQVVSEQFMEMFVVVRNWSSAGERQQEKSIAQRRTAEGCSKAHFD